jgi:uncharacterized protein (DUF1501 family)
MNSSQTRQSFLKGLASLGAGAAGSSLSWGQQSSHPNLMSGLHHPAKIKRVIHLCMAGGMSHLESFDYKPKLRELDGKPMPESFTKGEQLAQLQGNKLVCMGAQHDFSKSGTSGLEIANIFPNIQKVADKIAVINSMYTAQINHDPAHTFMNTGSIIPGRPSMGSWILYALGNMSKNLPGFVVLTSEGGAQGQPISSKQWHNGFLPGKFQGVQFQSTGDPLQYVKNPAGVSRKSQGKVVDAVNQMNGLLAQDRLDPDIATKMSQLELAYQMQEAIPELMDLKNEPKHIIDMYGCTPGDGSFASNCLLARKLIERDVRFIQLYHRGWDHHGGIKNGIATSAKYVDQSTAALISDLEQRGLLDDTLILFGGEFGRTPMKQGSGRDHHINAMSMFLCGGGIQGGMRYGATDELGYRAVENKTSVHDLHATMLHLMGIDHHMLRVKTQGLDLGLTGVDPCKVIKGILA